jgi:hypothetical protein
MSKDPNAIEFMSPIGRLVQGDVFKPSTVDMFNRPLLDKSGKPRVNYFISVAIPKKDQAMSSPQLIPAKGIPGGYILNWRVVTSVAEKMFPSFFPNGKCVHPAFSYKIIDGDSQVPNAKGIRPCDRDGWKGCWVVRFNNGFAPKIFSNGGKSIIVDADLIKPGYWIRVHGTCQGNKSVEKPGVFLNMLAIELVACGEEIRFGDSGDAFGADPIDQLPEGAYSAPIAPAPFQSTPPPCSVPSVPVTPPPFGFEPAPDFLTPQQYASPAALPPVAPPPPPPPVDCKYMFCGTVYSADELKKGGWTDVQISSLQKA